MVSCEHIYTRIAYIDGVGTGDTSDTEDIVHNRRIGLDGYALALAVYGSEVYVGEEVADELDCSLLVFVGGYGNLYAACLELVEQLHDTGVGAAVVGVVQALLGIMPGISRSGSTITGGRIFGLSREEAVRFSFLMSIPAILGACVTELPDLFAEGMSEGMFLPVIVGAVTAAAVGFFAIKLLQYISKNKGFAVFSVYCIIIGAAAIIADIAI